MIKNLENQLKAEGIGQGSVVVVASDVRALLVYLMHEDRMRNKKKKSPQAYMDDIIDMLENLVGEEGTLLFQTFTWRFCRGEAFDYDNTMGETGVLSNRALKRPEFKRTQHPIYSFAVWGKDMDYLVSMNNKDAFAKDSPFGYMHENNAVYVSIGVFDAVSSHGTSFFHYVEECNNVEYRFVKKFTAPYIIGGKTEERTYSFFVRYLCLDVELLPFEREWLKQKVISITDDIHVVLVKCSDMYDQITNDIKYNEARNIVSYNREMAAKNLQYEE